MTLVAKVVLAAVFAIAGFAKLADVPGSRRELSAFGLPSPLAAIAAAALPLWEVSVAAWLLLPEWSRWGSVAALASLLAFTVAIAALLLRRDNAPCRCFGQLSQRPVDRLTLGRNLVLLSLAGWIVWTGDTNRNGWAMRLSGRDRFLLAFASLSLLQAWVVFGLVQRYGRVLARLEALERASPTIRDVSSELVVGSVAPPFAVPDDSGRVVRLEELVRVHEWIVLLFVDAGCGPCAALAPDISRWSDELPHVQFVLVSSGTTAVDVAEHKKGRSPLLLQQRQLEITSAYGVVATPTAVVIRRGIIDSELAAGSADIARLMGELVHRSSSRRRDGRA